MINLRIDHHFHNAPQHDQVLAALKRIEKLMSKFTDEIADLNTELAQLTDAVQANGALIDAILDSVDENAADETALRQLVTDFRAQKDALVANTLKGTPSDPATPEEPAPEPEA